MNEIYFDNAASTKPFKAVIEKNIEVLNYYYANPSSIHKGGMMVENEIKASSRDIAEILNVDESEIIYTSGGTEANNLAFFGSVAKGSKNRHLITSKVEHSSVTACFKQMEQNGINVSYVNNFENGKIDIDELESLITADTAYVSIIHANNEFGTIVDIKEIGKRIKKKNKNTIFHVDGVQAFGKLPLDLSNCDVDLYSFSGHKIHGLKGTGALYVRKGVHISPRILGGSQQHGIRPGTQNVLGILALGTAAKVCYASLEDNYSHVSAIKQKISEIKDLYEGIYINGDEKGGSPYVLNLSIMGIKGEVLLNALSSRGIYISTGAACNISRDKGNILYNLNISRERAENAVRFSFSVQNTMNEAIMCLDVLKETVQALRKVMK